MSQIAEQMSSAFTALLLWAGASLIAVTVLAGAMRRRRAVLTETLKKHVVDAVGPIDPPGGDDEAK